MTRPVDWSVVIPTYNRASTIERAVRSVLEQDVPGSLQVVVSDDGSTDGTARTLDEMDDPRIMLIRRPNQGASAARNAGARAATGRFLAFLDSDDEALPGWLSAMDDRIDEVDAPLVRCGLLLAEDGRERAVAPAPMDRRLVHPRGAVLPGSFALARDLFLRVGGYEESLRFAENTELLLRLTLDWAEEGWDVPLIATPLVRVNRQHGSRAAQYASAPRQAAEFFLERHGAVLAPDRRRRHDLHAVIGTDLLRAGDRRRAASAFASSLACLPWSGKALLRLLSCALPMGLRERLASRSRSPRRTEPPLVAIACPGAGRVRRGYEVFAQEFAAQLAGRDDMRVVLLQGGSPKSPWTRRVRHLDRYGRSTVALAKSLRLRPTTLEHYTFALFVLPYVLFARPVTIVASERPLTNVLGWLRERGVVRSRIVLRNGGSHRPPFKHVDLVQHLAPASYRAALDAGEPAARHAFVPYAFDLPADARVLVPDDRRRVEARRELGLPVDAAVLLSVGSIDRSVKRMDHVVREVAGLPEPRPHLVLLGQRERETPDVESLAWRLLGSTGATIRQVGADEVGRYYQAADAFVLASPREGFGRVYVEALAHGLPCLVHDSPHTRWILDEHATYIDMFEPGQLGLAIAEMLVAERSATWASRAARHRFVYERFSWDRLLDDYVSMLRTASEL